jgi:hypothetical protein
LPQSRRETPDDDDRWILARVDLPLVTWKVIRSATWFWSYLTLFNRLYKDMAKELLENHKDFSVGNRRVCLGLDLPGSHGSVIQDNI